MKTVLRTLLIFLLAGSAAQAQFSPYNRAVDISLSTPSAITVNGVNSKFYESFLASDASSYAGAFFTDVVGQPYKLRALSYASSTEFTLSNGVVSIKNANENKIAKVAAFNIEDASAIVKFSFTLDLTNYTGANALIIAFGNIASSSTLVNSSVTFTTAQADIFGAFRVLLNSGTFITQYKNAAGDANVTTASVPATIPATTVSLIKPSQSAQQVEIFANSTTGAINYTYNSAPVSLAANSYHVYVNGVKHTETFPKIGTAYTQPAINAISFTSGGSATQETVKISNIKAIYQTSTLPVSLTSFTAKTEANGIRLNWKTASELNNDHFDILRSTDGKMFNTLTSVSGNGTTSKLNNYSYLDNAPESGTNYYQLSQVDKDGTATKSNVIAVTSDLSGQQAFTLNVNGNTLNASFEASTNGTATINIHDLSGRSVFAKSVTAQKGSNNISLQTPSFNTGIYVATLTQNGNSKSIKFVK